MLNLEINQKFAAYHKLLGTINYKYLGIEGNDAYNIKLLNLNDNTFSYVEPEWFNQRKINITGKEQ
jgi:hypothetical protein